MYNYSRKTTNLVLLPDRSRRNRHRQRRRSRHGIVNSRRQKGRHRDGGHGSRSTRNTSLLRRSQASSTRRTSALRSTRRGRRTSRLTSNINIGMTFMVNIQQRGRTQGRNRCYNSSRGHHVFNCVSRPTSRPFLHRWPGVTTILFCTRANVECMITLH